MSEMSNELRILACNGRLLAEIVIFFAKVLILLTISYMTRRSITFLTKTETDCVFPHICVGLLSFSDKH